MGIVSWLSKSFRIPIVYVPFFSMALLKYCAILLSAATRTTTKPFTDLLWFLNKTTSMKVSFEDNTSGFRLILSFWSINIYIFIRIYILLKRKVDNYQS